MRTNQAFHEVTTITLDSQLALCHSAEGAAGAPFAPPIYVNLEGTQQFYIIHDESHHREQR